MHVVSSHNGGEHFDWKKTAVVAVLLADEQRGQDVVQKAAAPVMFHLLVLPEMQAVHLLEFSQLLLPCSSKLAKCEIFDNWNSAGTIALLPDSVSDFAA